METAGTHITISRTHPNDIGLREVRIWLDDALIATLQDKQSVTRAITPGHHMLRAHNTLVGKRVEFDLEAGEHIRFITANRSGCATSLIFLLGAGPIYLSLERENDTTSAAVS